VPTSASRGLLLKLIHKPQGKSPLTSLDTLGHRGMAGLVKPWLGCGRKLFPAAAVVAMMSYMCITEYYNNTTLKIICWEKQEQIADVTGDCVKVLRESFISGTAAETWHRLGLQSLASQICSTTVCGWLQEIIS